MGILEAHKKPKILDETLKPCVSMISAQLNRASRKSIYHVQILLLMFLIHRTGNSKCFSSALNPIFHSPCDV